jgi:hypothetical protein
LVSLAAGLLAYAQPQASGGAEQPGYPRTVTAAELQSLLGDKETTIEYSIPQGQIRITLRPDGMAYGNKPFLWDKPAGQSSRGTWKIDAGQNKVCYQWENPRWSELCQTFRQTGIDTYVLPMGADKPASPVTITH